MVLHPRSARVSRPGLSLSIFGSHPRITAERLTVHRSTASKSKERAASVGAAAASPPATDDTKAAIRPPSEVACRRRFSGFIGDPRRDVTRGHDLLVDRDDPHGERPLAPDVGCWTLPHDAARRVEDSNPVLVEADSTAPAWDLAPHRGLLSSARPASHPA